MMRGRPTASQAGHALLLSVALVLSGCATSSGPAGPQPEFPAPLAGPGVPDTTPGDREVLRKGWAHLLAGELDAALRAARNVGKHPVAALLSYQVALVDHAPGLVQAIRELTERHPGWAAAQATLSLAAERAGDVGTTLASARAAARLWPTGRWRERAVRLEQELIVEPLARARALLDDGNSDQARELIRRVLDLEPDMPRARKMLGLLLVAEGEVDRAEEILVALQDDPEALATAARLAGERGDWATAMGRYRSLPDYWPGRHAALERSAIAWRLQNMPPYVRQASQSEHVTRAELSVLMTAVVPDLATYSSGATPLMPDIVGRPDQREILTVVRAELLRPDSVSRQFDPDATITIARIKAILDELAALLGKPAVPWCSDHDSTEQATDCVSLDDPTGTTVTRVLLRLLGGGGEQ